MGYWGTVVVARPTADLLVHQDGVDLFGYQHMRLRRLRDGWQLLETWTWDDPPDLAAASARLADSTGNPVLSAYVADSDCALLHVAGADGTASLAHLADPTRACRVYRHVPAPQPRTVDGVAADLLAWARGADLTPDADAVRRLVSYVHPCDADADGRVLTADEQVFALVAALGAGPVGAEVTRSVPAGEPPFSDVTGRFGLGRMAWQQAQYRAHFARKGKPAPLEQEWEAEALRLERDIWSAAYRPDADRLALAERAEKLAAAQEAATAVPS